MKILLEVYDNTTAKTNNKKKTLKSNKKISTTTTPATTVGNHSYCTSVTTSLLFILLLSFSVILLQVPRVTCIQPKRFFLSLSARTTSATATTLQNSNNNYNNNNNNDIMGATTTESNNKESAVLSELKSRIREQTAEIETLKQQLKDYQKTTATTTATSKAKKSVTSVSHGGGGHGGGGEIGEEDVSGYLTEPFYSISIKRVGWLGVFICSLSMTALIMTTFEHTLAKHIELAYFVPLLAGHGGNTGGQTVGTVLSALSAGIIKPSDAPKIITKEAMSGIMSGFILSCIVSPIAYKVLGISFHVATVLFFTMPLVSTIAAALGSTIPFVCLLLGLEPSVIAAPAMTSFVDVTGLMSYFLIANYIFKLYGLEL